MPALTAPGICDVFQAFAMSNCKLRCFRQPGDCALSEAQIDVETCLVYGPLSFAFPIFESLPSLQGLLILRIKPEKLVH